MKLCMKIVSVIMLVVFLLGAPKVGAWVAGLFDYSRIDPDGAFMWISIHHMVQALLILIVVFILTKRFKVDFHLGMGNKEVGFRYLKRFLLIFLVYVVVAFGSTMIISGVPSFQYPLTAKNIVGSLGFQLLLSGPSEEIIFRAFAMTMFVLLISKGRLNKHLSYANLFAALVFGAAHMHISLSPFDVSFKTTQVLLAIGLGYFYGDCYEKSKSVVYPMLMHSLSNVMMVGVTIALSYF